LLTLPIESGAPILNLPLPFSMKLFAVIAWLGLVGGLAEGLNRYTAIDPETTRKVVHIGVGHVILLAWWFSISVWVCISASVLFSIVALISYQIPILPSINGVGRNSLGTFFYAVSIGILTAIFWTIQHPEFGVIGVLVMTWGDGLAAIVGQRFGRHRYKIGGMQKSLEGSSAMILASYSVTLIILLSVQAPITVAAAVAFLVAIAATGLEAFSRWGVDNLTVPVGSALVAYGCTAWLSNLQL
jgi:phytol kinase